MHPGRRTPPIGTIERKNRTAASPVAVLSALVVGSFGVGMAEFAVMGLLPEVAQDLLAATWRESSADAIATAGWTITLYAAGAVIGAPLVAGLLARFPRRPVVVALAFGLMIGNLITAVMPTFELVAASRFVAALPHGAYFGIAALVAFDALGPGKRARGAAVVLIGLTLANVIGVPIGTLFGQAVGWRAAFVLVALVLSVATVAVALTVPQSAGDPTRTLRAELEVFRIPQVWFALGVGAVGFGGLFSVYSYIASLVTDVSGASRTAIPVILLLLGLGMTVGNVLGGFAADRNLRGSLLAGLLAISFAQALLALTASSTVAVGAFVFLVGCFSSTLAPAIQARLQSVAGKNQSIAAALNHSALNSGNALGAALGGVVIAAGFGFTAPIWVGAGLAAAGCGIAAVGFAVERREAQTAPALACD